MDSNNKISTEAAFRQFTQTVADQGVRSALAYLLTLTDYRYIAIFRRNGDKSTAAVQRGLVPPYPPAAPPAID